MERIRQDAPSEFARIRRYLGGEELNNSPRQLPNRFAFNISDVKTETEARARFPALLKLAEERVKPQRNRLKRAAYRDNWWRFGEPQLRLYDKISQNVEVLTISRVTTHHAFSRVPANMLFAESCVVTTFQDNASFAILQSRGHET
jgi:hypothetical protein